MIAFFIDGPCDQQIVVLPDDTPPREYRFEVTYDTRPSWAMYIAHDGPVEPVRYKSKYAVYELVGLLVSHVADVPELIERGLHVPAVYKFSCVTH